MNRPSMSLLAMAALAFPLNIAAHEINMWNDPLVSRRRKFQGGLVIGSGFGRRRTGKLYPGYWPGDGVAPTMARAKVRTRTR